MAEMLIVISGGEIVKSHCDNYTVFSPTCNTLLPHHSYSVAPADLPSTPIFLMAFSLLVLVAVVTQASEHRLIVIAPT